jgi:endonuclease VIII
MPEGPSILILKESVNHFTGNKVIGVTGNTKQDKDRMLNKRIISFQSWGKHFLICFKGFYVRVHFMLFGSYRINEKKENGKIRLGLKFRKGEINFYACSVKIQEGDPANDYNMDTDVLSETWDSKAAKKAVKSDPQRMVCDVLMDQNIFSGVGNIIKNEVLYRIGVHPESRIEKIPDKLITRLVKEARKYSFQFYEWKKIFQLKKHWKIYRQKNCPVCKSKPLIKVTGEGKRKSFICKNCQVLYR